MPSFLNKGTTHISASPENTDKDEDQASHNMESLFGPDSGTESLSDMESLFGPDVDMEIQASHNSTDGLPESDVDMENQALVSDTGDLLVMREHHTIDRSHSGLVSDITNLESGRLYGSADSNISLSESEYSGDGSHSEFERGQEKERLGADQIKILIKPQPPGDRADIEVIVSTNNEKSCNHSGAHASEELKFTGCAVLNSLDMYWSPALSCIVSSASSSVVAGQNLEKTLEKQNLAHIKKAFRIDVSEDRDTIWSRIKDKVLPQALHGLKDPRERFQCNICDRWYVSIVKHRCETKANGETEHSEGIDRDLQPHPSQCVFSGQTFQSYCLRLRVEEGAQAQLSTPAALNISEPETEKAQVPPLSIPPYVHRLQWLLWLQDIEVKEFMDTLEITSGPSVARKKRSEKSSTMFRVEDMILRIRNMMTLYLLDADVRLSSLNAAVRVAITSGTKGEFRPIQKSSALEYGSTATRAIAYALRYEAALTDSKSMGDNPSNLTPIAPMWKECQQELVLEFLKTHLLDGHEASNNDITAFIHKFLVSTFTAGFSVMKPVDSILEQTVVLRNFSDVRGWAKPGHLINAILKGLQYVSRAVLVHSGFLGGFSNAYTPPNMNSNDKGDSSATWDESSDSDSEDESDWGPTEVRPPTEDSDSEDGENEDDWGFTEVIPATEGSDGPDNILRFFQEQGQAFRSLDSKQWGRLSAMWAIALSFSTKDRSVTHIDWSENGHELTFTAPYQKATRINLAEVIDAIQAVPIALWELLLQMFPEDQTLELEKFSIGSVFDDPDEQTSLFLQRKNAAIFTPLHKALEKHLLANKPAHADFLKTSQQFLQKFVQCLMTCNGIPLRAKQVSLLQVAPTGFYPRNIYVKGGSCYIGKPRAKQMHFTKQHNYEAYWSLDAVAGRALLLYCGVVRPVVLLISGLSNAADTNPFLFLMPQSLMTKGKATWMWTGKMVNECLRLTGSPLKLEARSCRHIFTAILQEHLLRQASHISSTIPVVDQNSLNRSASQDQQLAFSQLVHVFFGIANPSCSSGPEIGLKCHNRNALTRARHLILTHYRLFGLPLGEIKKKVEELARGMPFLYGNGSQEDWIELGDHVLVETTATLIFGDSQPGITAVVPFYGYEPFQVATSVATIWTALQERREGYFVCFDQSTERSIARATKLFLEKLIPFRKVQPEAWHNFACAVHKEANKPLIFAEAPIMPPIVPNTALMPVDTAGLSTYLKTPTIQRQNFDIET